MTFDAGYAADAPNGHGLQNMVVSLLPAGTTTRQRLSRLRKKKERLGAILAASGSADRTTVDAVRVKRRT